MKSTLTCLFFCFAVISFSQESNSVRFMSDPSPSPDGNTLLFAYEGDIWEMDVTGGTAYRITAMEGSESLPRFSPDGKWIAFTGTQDGNENIYVVPSNGGEIKQLTFHSSFDHTDSWSWDSEQIYFTSGRFNNFSTYRVSIHGGTPQRLFSDHYWDNAHFVVEDPAGEGYIFSESGESFRSNNRKRYKGENNPDIKQYNPLKDQFKQVTDYEGKDLWPTIDGGGNIYFASDEGTTEYNLFTMKDGVKTRLTSFTSSIGRPQVSADGSVVVFTLDFEIHAWFPTTKETKKIPVKIFANKPLAFDKSFNTDGEITHFDISPDNKKIAFVSRGRLFISDIKGQFITGIETLDKERVMEALWLQDSKNLILIMTNHGWPNVYRLSLEGQPELTALNRSEKSARMLVMNADRDKAVYYSGTDELRMIDLKTFEETLLLNDEFWFRGSQPGFSPDDHYVLFTAYRHFEQDIMIYDLEKNRKTNLTSTYLTESDPFWSPDGKYIYFTADRTEASYPRGGSNNRLYRIPLHKYSKPFRSDEVEKVMADSQESVRHLPPGIDMNDLLLRWETPLNVGPRQSEPYVISKDTVTYVLFNSTHEGKQGFYKLSLNPFESPKTEAFKGITSGTVKNADKDYYALSRGKIYKLNLKSNKADEIKINYDFTKNLSDEFNQMFYEGWTVLAENYYDEKMHGTDWKAMRSKYETFLPYVRSRNDLRIIMNDMFGELNSSHIGFYSSGEEEGVEVSMVTASTGILFEKDNPYKVKRIIRYSPADNIYTDILPGDLLVSVDDLSVDEYVNRERYFIYPKMPEEITLALLRNGKRIETKIHPIGRINGLLYDEWIATNQERVDKLTDTRIGYVYLKDMGGSSLNRFLIEMTSEEVGKEGLIVDLRYNTGGNIHDDVLRFLSQKPYLNWKFREGMLSPQPHFAPSGKPIVLMINASSLSDAEMTTAGFKALGLGTVVGTETYRWIIFTSGARLVDGSFCRLPAWGCYTLDGTDLEFSGVSPDIYIENRFPDKVKGEDPQLMKAVEVILEQIQK